jgi:hypothetical protein
MATHDDDAESLAPARDSSEPFPSETQLPAPGDASMLAFSNLKDIEKYLAQQHCDWKPLDNDDTLPKSTTDRRAYVKRLLDAMTDMSHDDVNETGSYNKRWKPFKDSGDTSKLHYKIRNMEAVCWRLVDMAERYHLQGIAALPIYEPETLARAKLFKNTTFSDRIGAMAATLVESKMRIDKLMKCDCLETFMVMAPERLAQTARNAKNNLHKSRLIAKGKEADEATGEPKLPEARRRRGKKIERQDESSVASTKKSEPATIEDGADQQRQQIQPGVVQQEDGRSSDVPIASGSLMDPHRDAVQYPPPPEQDEFSAHQDSHYPDPRQNPIDPNLALYSDDDLVHGFHPPRPYYPEPDLMGQKHGYNEQAAPESHPTVPIEDTQDLSALTASILDNSLDPALVEGMVTLDSTTGMGHVAVPSGPGKRSRRADEDEDTQSSPAKQARH